MTKPVRVYIERDDYQWMVDRFGNDGVRPAQGVLGRKMRERIEEIESIIYTTK